MMDDNTRIVLNNLISNQPGARRPPLIDGKALGDIGIILFLLFLGIGFFWWTSTEMRIDTDRFHEHSMEMLYGPGFRDARPRRKRRREARASERAREARTRSRSTSEGPRSSARSWQDDIADARYEEKTPRQSRARKAATTSYSYVDAPTVDLAENGGFGMDLFKIPVGFRWTTPSSTRQRTTGGRKSWQDDIRDVDESSDDDDTVAYESDDDDEELD